ncbi:bifunctional 2-polyprenyl-6-hydroxyphenol methylase/3-demethylubiquinol 3-O-methyltransferase UbiG [Arthrobacter oryzae]|uniref:Class I SAM-dependent methyltransferase n=1 Tax=Arthrobacter oryzae TaxID=409290 RepID=A0A3N0BSM6_9MICC|nr:class I SAM-dependent methyltransferase [Arthrobacter oryzae]RNL52073.1 class I SAM-dependent methyltransferase [Arthrobacter oryzae]
MKRESLWEAQRKENPGHSAWYISRFEAMRAEGKDLHGEARFIDAMVPRSARILDAGCGPGRVGGELARLGHHITGVDLDPELVAAAIKDHPSVDWHVGDLSELNLPGQKFDLIVCAGNVMAFLAPGTAREVLQQFREYLAPDGRAVIGFGSGRGYDFETYFDDVGAAGLVPAGTFSTWDLRPFSPSSDFIVSILSPMP